MQTPSICQSWWLSRGSHKGKELNLVLGTIGIGMKCSIDCIFKPQSNIKVIPLKLKTKHGFVGSLDKQYYKYNEYILNYYILIK